MTDLDLYGSLAEYHKKISLTDIDTKTAITLAKESFKGTSELILTTNVVRTAGKRAKEWLRPHTLKNRTTYIDEAGNMVSVKSSKIDLRRLQFAAFQEMHDAIQILQQDKKQHVIELLKKSNPAMKRGTPGRFIFRTASLMLTVRAYKRVP